MRKGSTGAIACLIPPRLSILLELSSKDGPGESVAISIRMARKSLGMSSPSTGDTNKAIVSMIAIGIVERQFIEEDSRFIYSLTDAGHEMAKSCREALLGWSDAKVGRKRAKTPVLVAL